MDKFRMIIDEYNKYLVFRFGLIKSYGKIRARFRVEYPIKEEDLLYMVKNILYRSLFKSSIYCKKEYIEMFEMYLDNIV